MCVQAHRGSIQSIFGVSSDQVSVDSVSNRIPPGRASCGRELKNIYHVCACVCVRVCVCVCVCVCV